MKVKLKFKKIYHIKLFLIKYIYTIFNTLFCNSGSVYLVWTPCNHLTYPAGAFWTGLSSASSGTGP